MKTTPWYPHSIKPVRVGLYQSLTERFYGQAVILWRYWDGNQWGWGYENKRWAMSWRKEPGGSQYQPWRGLTKPCA